jgi:prepilin-type N-terminal cleavage/methylation domain-containing protein
MHKCRAGFTLIELLIVIVIIGILAAIAIPKFGKTREKAYFDAMKSDLRNLSTQQEVYFANPGNNYIYANDVSLLTDFSPSPGVSVNIAVGGTNAGWSATAAHAALDAATQHCAIFSGTVPAIPAPAVSPGIVMCTGE